jgi:hypothetical protein
LQRIETRRISLERRNVSLTEEGKPLLKRLRSNPEGVDIDQDGAPSVRRLTLWLFAYRRPGTIPHDARLDFALALSLLRLAPEEKKVYWKDGEAKQHGKHIGYRARRDVGVYIRQTLYILVKNMVEAINKEADRENSLKIVLAKEFK